MYVIVYAPDGMDSGFVYLTRKLADDELLDLGTFAAVVADDGGWTLDKSSGHIPNCCGDIRVEFTDHEPSVINDRYQGSTCIWSGQSYYFNHDE